MHGICFDCILSANEKNGYNESHLAGDNTQNGIHGAWCPTHQKQKTGRTILSYLIRLLTSWGAFLILIHSGYILDRVKGLTAMRTTKLLKLLEFMTFTFPDLRHCAINNIRLAVNGHYTSKQDYGHKKDIAMIRYNLVIEEEMQWMKWLDKTGVKNGMMDA